MLIWGWYFFVWGSRRTQKQYQCGRCGKSAQFIWKSGMRFFTIFFIIPLFPISGVRHMIECPICHTRFEAPADARPVGAEDVAA